LKLIFIVVTLIAEVLFKQLLTRTAVSSSQTLHKYPSDQYSATPERRVCENKTSYSRLNVACNEGSSSQMIIDITGEGGAMRYTWVITGLPVIIMLCLYPFLIIITIIVSKKKCTLKILTRVVVRSGKSTETSWSSAQH